MLHLTRQLKIARKKRGLDSLMLAFYCDVRIIWRVNRTMSYLKIFITVVAAVVVTLAAYERVNKYRYQDYQSHASLIEGIQMSHTVRNQVDYYYNLVGLLPSSNHDLDLPAPEKFSGDSLISLEVSEGGVITATFNEKSGVENGVIVFTPDVENMHMGIKWRCSTPSYKKINVYSLHCEYNPTVN